ncbi:hypothetical protein ACFE04_009585 [Oxalis oulophora]
MGLPPHDMSSSHRIIAQIICPHRHPNRSSVAKRPSKFSCIDNGSVIDEDVAALLRFCYRSVSLISDHTILAAENLWCGLPMPGNEVGDRIHNFFGQENLSQGQHHSQLADGSWPGLSNNLWVGNERQIDADHTSNLKNYNIHQQADPERGFVGQASGLPHGLSISQSPFRPEFSRNQSHNQQSNLNGYMQGHQAFQTRHNEANFLGMDTASNQHNFTSQLGNSPELKQDSARLESNESPVNYDFFGGQQQISGQHPSMLMQQQLMLKQMQELQRQQQVERSSFQQQVERSPFQQQEIRQLNSMGPQLSSVPKQSTSNQLINGVPLHDTSGYSWQPDVMAGNMNWLQRGGGASPLIQGSPSGSMLSPEQFQTMRLIGMIPQQVDQSLFGVPVSNSKGITSQHLPQINRPGTTNSFSFPSNQYAAFPDQVSMQDAGLLSRQGYAGQNACGPTGQNLNSGLNLHQVNIQPRNSTDQETRGNTGQSDTSHEKIAMSAPVQTEATLDPTEKRILFGSDDNIWDAFGESIDPGSGGLNSWSALMQSAAGETSSGNAGIQDEFTHINRTPTRNQQQSAWADKNSQAASTPISRPITPQSDDAKKTNENYSNSGVRHIGSDTFPEQRSKKPSLGFVQNLAVADSKFYANNNSHPSDGGSWSGQNTSSYNTNGQPPSRPNGWNFIESTSPARDANLQHFQNNHKNDMLEEMGSAKPATRNLPSFNDSGDVRDNQGIFQPRPSGHNLNFWKNVNAGHSRDSGVPGNYQLQQDKRSQIESLGNSSADKGTVRHDGENSNMRENSSDSSRINLPHHTSTSGRRENVQLDARDSFNFSSGNQKSTGQISRKPPVTRKFQYHPMGDLDPDVEPSFAAKAINPQAMAHQAQISKDLKGRDEEYNGQSKHFGQFTNASETDKARLAGFQRDTKGPDGLLSKSFYPGSVPGTTAPSGGPVGGYSSNKTVQSSQNMLELLHKVDQSGSASHVSSDYNQSSEIPETENSGGSVGLLQQNQPSSSRGFALQLGPPSQRFPTPDRSINIQSSSQTVNSLSGPHDGSVKSMHPTHETSLPEIRNNTSPSSISVNKTLLTNTERNFSGIFPHSTSPLHNQLISAHGQANSETLGQSFSQPRKPDESHDRFQAGQSTLTNSNVNKQNQVMDSAHPFHVLEATPASLPCVTQGMSQNATFSKMLPSAWTNINTAAKPYSSGTQTSNSPSNFMSHLQSGNAIETTLPRTRKLDDPINERQESQGEESAKNHQVDPSPSQKDIEAFGRSLRRNKAMNQNYPLLNQVQAMKNLETNTLNVGVKKFKGPDCGLDTQQVASSGVQYGSDAMVRNLSTNNTNTSSADPRTQIVSSKPGENHDAKASNQSNSSDNNAALRGERSQISPQMAPSWFNQYGSFKNGQILSTHDSRKMGPLKTVEQPVVVTLDSLRTRHSAEQVNAANHPFGDTSKDSTTPAVIENERFSSPQLLPADKIDHSLVVRPKKRKSSSMELLPWHREVALDSHRVQTFSRLNYIQNLFYSAAVAEWAQMANVLIEKIENEAELLQDGHPALKSKRRLIFTTQLMQELLRPAPSVVLSADANAHYESVAYFVTRLVSGDGCKLVSYPGCDTPVSAECGNPPHEKGKGSGRTGHQYLLKAAEDLVGKAEKLENDFLRTEKASSILDLRLECQDLERFSVINRFAKFHGRNQPDAAETSSSSEPQKLYPMRYVTAAPMPKNVPENEQCLSL